MGLFTFTLYVAISLCAPTAYATSISYTITYTGDFCRRFQQQLKGEIHSHEVDVTVNCKLRLIMPKMSLVSREVTTANYRECFSLIRESSHDLVITETIERMLIGKLEL